MSAGALLSAAQRRCCVPLLSGATAWLSLDPLTCRFNRPYVRFMCVRVYGKACSVISASFLDVSLCNCLIRMSLSFVFWQFIIIVYFGLNLVDLPNNNIKFSSFIYFFDFLPEHSFVSFFLSVVGDGWWCCWCPEKYVFLSGCVCVCICVRVPRMLSDFLCISFILDFLTLAPVHTLDSNPHLSFFFRSFCSPFCE